MPVNLPCLELCVDICEALIAETGIGVILCVLGCAIACDSDTQVAGGFNNQDILAVTPDPDPGYTYEG